MINQIEQHIILWLTLFNNKTILNGKNTSGNSLREMSLLKKNREIWLGMRVVPGCYTSSFATTRLGGASPDRTADYWFLLWWTNLVVCHISLESSQLQLDKAMTTLPSTNMDYIVEIEQTWRQPNYQFLCSVSGLFLFQRQMVLHVYHPYDLPRTNFVYPHVYQPEFCLQRFRQDLSSCPSFFAPQKTP